MLGGDLLDSRITANAHENARAGIPDDILVRDHKNVSGEPFDAATQSCR
jgi:hypothetical protein